jgi:3-oxoacyl-[acyl-carrier-protein] synthase III
MAMRLCGILLYLVQGLKPDRKIISQLLLKRREKVRKVAVIGVGMTKFGKLIGQSIEELGVRAAWDAIKDAGINPKDIQIAYCGNVIVARDVIGQAILKDVGINQIPITRVEDACASGSCALREAAFMRFFPNTRFINSRIRGASAGESLSI